MPFRWRLYVQVYIHTHTFPCITHTHTHTHTHRRTSFRAISTDLVLGQLEEVLQPLLVFRLLGGASVRHVIAVCVCVCVCVCRLVGGWVPFFPWCVLSLFMDCVVEQQHHGHGEREEEDM